MGSSRFSRNLKIKYFLDRILAFPALFFAAPFILVAAWIIKLDGWLYPENKGEIFYLEPRVSAGKRFKVIKFRTVTSKGLKWVCSKPESRSISYCSPRTPAGRFITKWYFDEVPQVFNILKGEMSFVGPRPHIINIYERELNDNCFYRQIMKAGFFGIPQACKRNPKHLTMFRQMVQKNKTNEEALNTLDGLYARECMRRSIFDLLLLDWVIFARFIVVLFRRSTVNETRLECDSILKEPLMAAGRERTKLEEKEEDF